MGRKRKPDSLLRLTGSKRLYDRPKNQPKPVLGRPKPPAFLKGEARKEWKRKVDLLYKQGTLTLVDDIAFAAYCIFYEILKAAYDACRDEENKNKIQLLDDKNKRKSELMILKSTLSEIRGYLAEFGMTPSARSGINLPKNPDDVVGKAQAWLANSGA